MSALVAAELLRLRTVRSPRYFALGGLALVALIAAVNFDASLARSPEDLIDTLVALAMVAVLVPAVFAASTAGEDFKRGSAAMTYLSDPHRVRVSAARALTYAGLGFVFAALASSSVVAIGLSQADLGLSATAVAQLIGGAAFAGAVLSAAGVLVGTVTRNPTIATGGVVGLNLAETLLGAADIAPYLPFRLVGSLLGMSDGVSALAALGLLLAYLAAFALSVRAWALPRDLT
jgi:hypothetical protein